MNKGLFFIVFPGTAGFCTQDGEDVTMDHKLAGFWPRDEATQVMVGYRRFFGASAMTLVPAYRYREVSHVLLAPRFHNSVQGPRGDDEIAAALQLAFGSRVTVKCVDTGSEFTGTVGYHEGAELAFGNHSWHLQVLDSDGHSTGINAEYLQYDGLMVHVKIAELLEYATDRLDRGC